MQRVEFPEVTFFRKEFAFPHLGMHPSDWDEHQKMPSEEEQKEAKDTLHKAIAAGLAGLPRLEHLHLLGVDDITLLSHLFGKEGGLPPHRKAALKSLKINLTDVYCRTIPGSLFRGMTSLERLDFQGGDMQPPLAATVAEGALPSLHFLRLGSGLEKEKVDELVTAIVQAEMLDFKALMLREDTQTDCLFDPLLLPSLEVEDLERDTFMRDGERFSKIKGVADSEKCGFRAVRRLRN
jgi:hypothetical protein